MSEKNYDFIIVGAGIIGLTIARELVLRRQSKKIILLEKEPALGRHASGRNSGVLHAGIYYPANSFKAKVCVSGGRLMRKYAEEKGIALRQFGKVIVAKSSQEVGQLDLLRERALSNGAEVQLISSEELKKIEPLAFSYEQALYSPQTSVIDPHQVLDALEAELHHAGVTILKSTEALSIDPGRKIIITLKEKFSYGHLINAAGLGADKLAHQMGVGEDYFLLPFKGIYRKVNPLFGAQINSCIYPVPNVNMPFLGVHFTKTIAGDVTLGPTAIPALGRENYHLLDDLSIAETPGIILNIARMYLQNRDHFRNLVHEEVPNYWLNNFVRAAQRLVPTLQLRDVNPTVYKVGIRPQLIDKTKMSLVMDFVIESGPASTHVLNAISPAFTASMAFAKVVCERIDSMVR